jgi:hypothetical protein
MPPVYEFSVCYQNLPELPMDVELHLSGGKSILSQKRRVAKGSNLMRMQFPFADLRLACCCKRLLILNKMQCGAASIIDIVSACV